MPQEGAKRKSFQLLIVHHDCSVSAVPFKISIFLWYVWTKTSEQRQCCKVIDTFQVFPLLGNEPAAFAELVGSWLFLPSGWSFALDPRFSLAFLFRFAEAELEPELSIRHSIPSVGGWDCNFVASNPAGLSDKYRFASYYIASPSLSWNNCNTEGHHRHI